jgi:glycosyltransferase involved in cell wall biosynthesis
MRLLVASHTTQLLGGAERYLADVLPSLLDRGDDVTLLTEDDGSGPLGQSCTRLLVRGPELARQLADFRPGVLLMNGLHSTQLERELLGQFACVMFAHNYYGTCISGEKRTRIPQFEQCHRKFGAKCLALYFPKRCGGTSVIGAIGAFKLQSARQQLLAQYKRVLVTSNHMRAEYERHTSVPIDVVPPFVDEPLETGTTASGIPSLVYVGRMTDLKGPQDFLSASAWALSRRTLDLRLVLIGDGPSRPRLERLGRTLRLPTTFTGWLNPSDRDAALAGAAALLLPSLWPEPFGLVGLEAARLGVPAIAYDVGGVRDWLTDGFNGFLVSTERGRIARMGEAILRVLEDHRGSRRLAANAPAVARRFSRAQHLRLLDRSLAMAAGG